MSSAPFDGLLDTDVREAERADSGQRLYLAFLRTAILKLRCMPCDVGMAP